MGWGWGAGGGGGGYMQTSGLQTLLFTGGVSQRDLRVHYSFELK